MSTLKTTRPDAWAIRHNAAIDKPSTPAEGRILGLAATITNYAIEAENDYLMTEQVMPHLLAAFRTLLNWDLGRLDGGTLDAWALATASSLGIKEEEL